MAEHRTDRERRREVDEWRASGEGVRQYAARRGYAEATLRKWIAAATKPSGAPGLVRVVAESALHAADTTIVVDVGSARIRVSRGFDAELLRAVVVALSELRS